MITEKTWEEVQSLYLAGTALREIGRQCKVSEGAIRSKAIKEGWQSDLRKKIISKRTDLQDFSREITQQITHKQAKVIESALTQEITHNMEVTRYVNSHQKSALSIHGTILKRTKIKLDSGEIGESEAARIIQAQGLSVDKIAGMSGIGKSGTNVNIQNNVGEDDEKVTINIIGVE